MPFVTNILKIIEYIPSPQDFAGFDFLFNYNDNISTGANNLLSLNKNFLTHEIYFDRKDIFYSIKVLNKKSLIGESQFRIPFRSILYKGVKSFETLCSIRLKEDTKKYFFENTYINNCLRIRVQCNLKYHGENEKDPSDYPINANNIDSLMHSNYFRYKKIPKNSNVNFHFLEKLSIKKSSNDLNDLNRSYNKINKTYILQTKNLITYTSQTDNNPYFIENNYKTLENNTSYNIPVNDFSNIDKHNNYHSVEKNNYKNYSDSDDSQKLKNKKYMEDIDEFADFMPRFLKKYPLYQIYKIRDVDKLQERTKDTIINLLNYQQQYYQKLQKLINEYNTHNSTLKNNIDKFKQYTLLKNKIKENKNFNNINKNVLIRNRIDMNSNLNKITSIRNQEIDLYKEIYNIPDDDNESNEQKKYEIFKKLYDNCIENYGPLDKKLNPEKPIRKVARPVKRMVKPIKKTEKTEKKDNEEKEKKEEKEEIEKKEEKNEEKNEEPKPVKLRAKPRKNPKINNDKVNTNLKKNLDNDLKKNLNNNDLNNNNLNNNNLKNSNLNNYKLNANNLNRNYTDNTDNDNDTNTFKDDESMMDNFENVVGKFDYVQGKRHDDIDCELEQNLQEVFGQGNNQVIGPKFKKVQDNNYKFGDKDVIILEEGDNLMVVYDKRKIPLAQFIQENNIQEKIEV